MSDNNIQLFEENLNFLKQHSSNASFQNIISAPDTEELKTDSTSSKITSFCIETAQGVQLALHSKRRPIDEAKNQITAWQNDESPKLYGMTAILGFAGMFHIEVLLEQQKSGSTLFIADCNPALVKKALGVCKLANLAKNGVDIVIASSQHIHEIADEYRFHLRMKPNLDTSFFTHPGLARIFPEKLSSLLEALYKECKFEAMNRGTMAYYSAEWERNAIQNLPLTLSHPPLNCIKDIFAGKTAIVVAAGPSLDRSIPFIKQVANKSVIIAVGTAFKPLSKAGIKPDFVVVVDSYHSVIKQFEEIETGKTFLLAHHQIMPDLMKKFEQQLLIFSINTLVGFNSYLEQADALPDRLTVGGTVSVSAVDAAIYMGSEKIIFAGLDLACKQDGTSHAQNSVYESSVENNLVEVEGNYERKVLAEKHLAYYIDIINNYIYSETKKNRSIKFYNATDAGAKIDGVTLIQPEEIPERIEGEDFDKFHMINSKYNGAKLPSKKSCLHLLEESKRQLRELQKSASEAVEASKIVLDKTVDDKKHEEMINRLSTLDARINSENSAKLILSEALRVPVMNLCSNSAEDTPEKIMHKSMEFYAQVRDLASGIAELVKQAGKEYASYEP